MMICRDEWAKEGWIGGGVLEQPSFEVIVFPPSILYAGFIIVNCVQLGQNSIRII